MVIQQPQRRDPPSFSVPAARPALPNIIMGAPADADSEDDDDSDGSSISDIEVRSPVLFPS